jgi:hypothetical protein
MAKVVKTNVGETGPMQERFEDALAEVVHL